ncbi:hypothetical protein GCM10022284_34890 [Streptomyces hundungensis]
MWVTAATAVTKATGCRLGQESGPSRIRENRDVPDEPEPESGTGVPDPEAPALPGPVPDPEVPAPSGPAPVGFVRVRALAALVALVVLVLAVLSARVGVGSAVVTAALPAHAVSPGKARPCAAAHGPRGPSGRPLLLDCWVRKSLRKFCPDSKDAVPASPVARS